MTDGRRRRSEVADKLEELFTARACDGFVIGGDARARRL